MRAYKRGSQIVLFHVIWISDKKSFLSPILLFCRDKHIKKALLKLNPHDIIPMIL